MQRLYRRQAWAFDWTRLPVLRGRGLLARHVSKDARVLQADWLQAVAFRASGSSSSSRGRLAGRNRATDHGVGALSWW